MLWRVIRAVLTWVMALNLRTSIFRRTTTNIYDVLLNNSKNHKITNQTMDIFACLEETGFDKHFSN